jgi:hypothetical protein
MPTDREMVETFEREIELNGRYFFIKLVPRLASKKYYLKELQWKLRPISQGGPSSLPR